MFETDVADGVLRFARTGTRWLSTGWNGGYCTADAAYNVTVPDGFDRTDLDAYAGERRADAGFEPPGPTLLTGVEMQHARGAHLGPVTCLATAGVSNPTDLPMVVRQADPPADGSADVGDSGNRSERECESGSRTGREPGTVNLLLGTTRSLDDGALATMLATAVEAKTATVLARTGFTGTTTDAVVAGCDPAGRPVEFAGSGTAVGTATRACVREAVSASLASRYAETALPASVEDAEYGTRTTERASVFSPGS